MSFLLLTLDSLFSTRCAQDMSHGVQQGGMPAAAAAERHDVQTAAKANAAGSSRMVVRRSVGRSDQPELVVSGPAMLNVGVTMGTCEQIYIS
jgi:hypothetical protein